MTGKVSFSIEEEELFIATKEDFSVQNRVGRHLAD
jgi:hypothetical protein